MSRPPSELIFEGHLTRARVRRKKADHRPGYIYVEVEVWEGSEATGEPYDVWELPYTFRYSLDAAARLAVRQTSWPDNPAEPAPAPEMPPADDVEVTFVMTYRRRGDGKLIRLSGRDRAEKIRAVDRAIRAGTDVPVWLHIHRADHGVREPWSETMSMLFTTPAIASIAIEEVDTVIEEEVG